MSLQNTMYRPYNFQIFYRPYNFQINLNNVSIQTMANFPNIVSPINFCTCYFLNAVIYLRFYNFYTLFPRITFWTQDFKPSFQPMFALFSYWELAHKASSERYKYGKIGDSVWEIFTGRSCQEIWMAFQFLAHHIQRIQVNKYHSCSC